MGRCVQLVGWRRYVEGWGRREWVCAEFPSNVTAPAADSGRVLERVCGLGCSYVLDEWLFAGWGHVFHGNI